MGENSQTYNNITLGNSDGNLFNKISNSSFDEQYRAIVLLDFSRKSEMRVAYANKIFSLVCIYLCVVGVMLWQGGMELSGFQLSDNVLIALLTTTTANVIGLFTFVVKYLFPNDKK